MAVSIILVALLAGLVVVGVVAFVFMRANQVDLTGTGDEKPEWMRQTPPSETIMAVQTDGEGFQVFDHDPGEKLASPFAEQIEDILRARMQADPELNQYDVDLGTAPDGTLEIWVNSEKFDRVENLPDERLRQVFQEAIDSWNKH